MEKLKIYLDNCCFNRPYDDQSSLSVYLETQAKMAIQELVKDVRLELFWSFILDFENSFHPDEVIKNEIAHWRGISKIIIHKNDAILEMGKVLEIDTKEGFKISTYGRHPFLQRSFIFWLF